MSRSVVLVLFSLVVLSSLVMVGSVSAQEFTVEFFDNSYYVPPAHSIDPYTGENVTVDGYHVEDKTIKLTIKNQLRSSYHDYFYNVRVKGHFEEIWQALFSYENGPEMSGSVYTVITFSSSGDDVFRNRDSNRFDAPSGGQIDFQVQAFMGYYESSDQPFSGGWVFKTEKLSWSETQTLAIPEVPTPSPEPTPEPTSTPTEEPQPSEQDMTAGSILVVISFVVFLGLLFYFIKRKQSSLK